MIGGVTNSEGIATLERLVQFAGQRHRLIVNNIANIDTPGYRSTDVSVKDFQKQLGDAIDERREAGRPAGPLELKDSSQVEFSTHSLVLHPTPIGENILFHDGNDRDLERTMQDLVENFLTFRMASELVRNRFDLLHSAISERV
jgi:flagellar basal-body rod protein FlgB